MPIKSVVESFFRDTNAKPSTYKRLNHYHLIRTIDEYIYWYNHERIKLTLGGYSPIQYTHESNDIITTKNIKYKKMVSIQNSYDYSSINLIKVTCTNIKDFSHQLFS